MNPGFWEPRPNNNNKKKTMPLTAWTVIFTPSWPTPNKCQKKKKKKTSGDWVSVLHSLLSGKFFQHPKKIVSLHCRSRAECWRPSGNKYDPDSTAFCNHNHFEKSLSREVKAYFFVMITKCDNTPIPETFFFLKRVHILTSVHFCTLQIIKIFFTM